MKKAIDNLINKRKDVFIIEGFVTQVNRNSADVIVSASVSFGGATREIATTLQNLFVKDLVEIQVPFGDLSRATIVNKSKVYGDFTHYSVGTNDG